MPKFRSVPALLFLVVASLSIGAVLPLANGQTLASTASFSGTVSDSSGARVANASVGLSSPEKGITRDFKTDDEGNFSFSLLPAGAYTLTVQATGFKTFKQEGVTLEVGQSASQSVTLTIGATEQIEVAAAAALLQTDNANVGDEVSTKQVTELPLNLRNVFNFVTLNSSVNNISQGRYLTPAESRAVPIRTSRSLTSAAVISERPHFFWMEPGTPRPAGAESSMFHPRTTCKSLRCNRIRSPRNTAGVLGTS